MNCEQSDFTRKYNMKIRPADFLGIVAAGLLVITPLLNSPVSVGLGVALLVSIGLCHFPKGD
jgi:hypothetical protein